MGFFCEEYRPVCNDQSVLLIVWIWDDLIFLPYLFTIPPSSNYLLREMKQSKKQSRQSARDLIKAVSCATEFFLCLCLQAQAYKSG